MNGCMLGGDFNDILNAEEKKGIDSISIREWNKFKSRIGHCGFMDLGFNDYQFTWRGSTYHFGKRIYDRLDRALCNDYWRMKFLDAFGKVLTRLKYSYHHPFFLSFNDQHHSSATPKFNFEGVWLLEEY
ncbi:unnamed protein product [Lathyrus sativus]|nr:unnamed protein product [Lathyrus sativus]